MPLPLLLLPLPSAAASLAALAASWSSAIGALPAANESTRNSSGNSCQVLVLGQVWWLA
jgi:hypothetical protein